jgi:hypothetical protein
VPGALGWFASEHVRLSSGGTHQRTRFPQHLIPGGSTVPKAGDLHQCRLAAQLWAARGNPADQGSLTWTCAWDWPGQLTPLTRPRAGRPVRETGPPWRGFPSCHTTISRRVSPASSRVLSCEPPPVKPSHTAAAVFWRERSSNSLQMGAADQTDRGANDPWITTPETAWISESGRNVNPTT